MCGIFGAVRLATDTGAALDEPRFAAALTTIAHRGPDAQAVQGFGQRALLGHVRLSILDLDPHANQPFTADGRYSIIYNGEIFNYLELRGELQALGVRFRTSSDTEVLLQSYVRWGEDCVDRFNGMWAFAIFDAQTGTLFCARDRFGEKPFNYAVYDGAFLFASEIKALLAYAPALAEPNYNAIANYCRTSVGAQHTGTWFRQVQRLAPGHTLRVSGASITLRRYWRYPSGSAQRIGMEQAQEAYRELFTDAVRLRMRSDVPIGLTLSSGLDSTAIACTMQRLDSSRHHAFTAAFNPADYQASETAPYATPGLTIDEATVARRLASEIGLESHVIVTNYQNLVASTSETIHHLESGNSSPAVLPLMQVMRHARGHVKVLLEGQGSDELMGGYIVSAIWPAILELLAQGRLDEARQSMGAFLEGHALAYAVKIAVRNLSNSVHLLSSMQQRFSGIESVFGPLLRDYTRLRDYPQLPGEGGSGWMSQLLTHQHSGGLVNLLHYGDALSMAHGIESRMPFLDHRLVEQVWTLPANHKVRRGVGKALHRQAMRGIVPDYILDQKVKLGFTTPIARQFKNTAKGEVDPLEVLLDRRCMERGIFTRAGLLRLVRSHRENRRDHGNLLYRLLSVELWFREFMDTGRPTAAS